MALSNAEKRRRHREGIKRGQTSTERVRRHRERKRRQEQQQTVDETVKRRVGMFPYTVRNELRRAIRQGCLRPFEFFVDRHGTLRDLRTVLFTDEDYEVLFDEREAHAIEDGEWPEVEDVTVSAGDDLPFVNEHDRRRYDAVTDAVIATASSLGIELTQSQ
jgi:hypothetical protein